MATWSRCVNVMISSRYSRFKTTEEKKHGHDGTKDYQTSLTGVCVKPVIENPLTKDLRLKTQKLNYITEILTLKLGIN